MNSRTSRSAPSPAVRTAGGARGRRWSRRPSCCCRCSRSDLDLDWAGHPGAGSAGGCRARAARAGRPPAGAGRGGDADLVVVPALAVDGSRAAARPRRRLYDRALARVPAAYGVALLHDGELVTGSRRAARPAGPAVVTPAGGLRPSRRPRVDGRRLDETGPMTTIRTRIRRVPQPARSGGDVPTYQYACTACGHQLEAVQSFSDEPLTECPACEGRCARSSTRSASSSRARASTAPTPARRARTARRAPGKAAKPESTSGGDSGSSSGTSSTSSSNTSTGSSSARIRQDPGRQHLRLLVLTSPARAGRPPARARASIQSRSSQVVHPGPRRAPPTASPS